MGRGRVFPAYKNLADILGRTDFDFENFYFLIFVGSQISGLGPLGPHVGPPTLGPTWAHPLWTPRVPTHLDPTWMSSSEGNSFVICRGSIKTEDS